MKQALKNYSNITLVEQRSNEIGRMLHDMDIDYRRYDWTGSIYFHFDRKKKGSMNIDLRRTGEVYVTYESGMGNIKKAATFSKTHEDYITTLRLVIKALL